MWRTVHKKSILEESLFRSILSFYKCVNKKYLQKSVRISTQSLLTPNSQQCLATYGNI